MAASDEKKNEKEAKDVTKKEVKFAKDKKAQDTAEQELVFISSF